MLLGVCDWGQRIDSWNSQWFMQYLSTYIHGVKDARWRHYCKNLDPVVASDQLIVVAFIWGLQTGDDVSILGVRNDLCSTYLHT